MMSRQRRERFHMRSADWAAIRVRLAGLNPARPTYVNVIAALVVGTAIVGVAVAAQQQPRDNAPVPAGTASISGTVFVDGAAKQPARRVRVTLTNVARTTPGQTTTTDDSGAFAFRGLPPGRFELQAFKNGYLRASYGALRPDRAGTPIVVKDGEAITNLAMTIARGGVIAGVVRDVQGRPVPGITVRVLKLGYNALTGERSLGVPGTAARSVRPTIAASTAPSACRRAGISSCDPAATGRSGGPGVDDIRQFTSDEVQRALQTARAGASAAAARTPPHLHHRDA